MLLLLLLQLAKDRPDVVKYLPSELQKRILVMPPPVALSVLGSLNDLPAGWEAGHKKPAVQLAAAVARAESYAREQHDSSGSGAAGGSGWGDGGSGGDGDGWVTAGREAGKGFGPAAVGGGRHSSNGDAEGRFGVEAAAAGPAAGGAGGGSSSVGALWKQLQSQRPDVWRALHDRHKALITPLTQEQQKKVRRGGLCEGGGWCCRAVALACGKVRVSGCVEQFALLALQAKQGFSSSSLI